MKSNVAEQSAEIAVARYIEDCRGRIEPFVRHHFCWPGLVRVQRVALGWDLLRAPANVMLAVPAFILLLLSVALSRIGLERAARGLLRIRLGFTTAQERWIQSRIKTELLALGTDQNDWRGLLRGEAFASLDGEPRQRLENALVEPHFVASMHALVSGYAATRRAASDLTTALAIGVVGWLAFGQFTPGSLSSGQVVAADVSRRMAIADFPFGDFLGGAFYAVFAPSVSMGTVVVSIAVVSVALSTLSAFAGLVADPIQARLGLHRRRLLRWLAVYERRLLATARGDFRPWDPYVARLIDLMDAIKALGPT
ncbi:MAG: DUF6635 family protein [Pseudomonadota bacterium]